MVRYNTLRRFRKTRFAPQIVDVVVELPDGGNNAPPGGAKGRWTLCSKYINR